MWEKGGAKFSGKTDDVFYEWPTREDSGNGSAKFLLYERCLGDLSRTIL